LTAAPPELDKSVLESIVDIGGVEVAARCSFEL
jgi:hypothetical protein